MGKPVLPQASIMAWANSSIEGYPYSSTRLQRENINASDHARPGINAPWLLRGETQQTDALSLSEYNDYANIPTEGEFP